MEFNEKDMLLIEDYLDGKLSDKSLEAFEKRLRTDKDFARAVELRKKMPSLMRDANDLESTRDEVRMAIQQQKQTRIKLTNYWLYAAASVIILTGLFLLIRYNLNQSSEPGTRMADENNQETLRTDEPENFAKLNEFVAEIELVSPVDFKKFKKGETVTLKWKTTNSAQATIIIKMIGNIDNTVQSEIFLSDGKFDLDSDSLIDGRYEWFINDSTKKGSFSIISP